jgi:hypothetical protein
MDYFCLAPRGTNSPTPAFGENNIDSALCLADCLVETIKIYQLGDVSLKPTTLLPIAVTASSSSF